MASAGDLIVRTRGREAYPLTWAAMQAFTAARNDDTVDELWLIEHPPVFTLGQAGRPEHLLAPGEIPVVRSDRGGQVTYHGPGQLVAYLLFDLRRLGLGPRRLVELTEAAIVATLADLGIPAYPRSDAHGVYVDGADGQPRKIASLGLRIRRGCSYHGLALNHDMNLEPFSRINPCGHAGLRMTRVSDETARTVTAQELADRLVGHIRTTFGFGNPR